MTKKGGKRGGVKRIGIDARFYGPKNRGLGRYVQKLVDYLHEEDGNNPDREYYIFLKKENFDLFKPKAKNFKKVKANFHWYGFSEQIIFPLILNRYKLDLVHFPHFNVPLFYKGDFVVTIHDLILLHYPTVRATTLNKYFYFIKLLGYKKAIKSAAKRAKKIITVSNFTKKDIHENLNVPASKITVTYEGCDFGKFKDKFLNEPEKILKKYNIKKPYLLYAGNAYPHKNLERLVLAFKKVQEKNKELSLVLMSQEDFFYRRLKEFIKRKEVERVIFPGYVLDEELSIIYNQADLYVFPSLYEGFGLPPLEALASGTSVISSDRTAMPEVLGGDALDYFDPENVDDIAEKINKNVDKKKIIPGGFFNKYSWEKMTQETLGVYDRVLVRESS